ncbi:MAG: hypothetical protein ACERLM_14900 [Acidimicrobiales bacterium]
MSPGPPPLAGADHVSAVLRRLTWMQAEGIWPDGTRYLWTDAFGVVLLCSLADATGQGHFLDRAERLVADVDSVLGRSPGYRIGEAADRDGQYFHYLTVWAFALGVLGARRTGYHERALELVRAVHGPFVIPGRGIWWKMSEDLSGPYPGYGLGGLDPFQARAVYRFLDAGTGVLAAELDDLAGLIEPVWRDLVITQDLGLGMMLWSARRCRDEAWAAEHEDRSLAVLDRMWVDPPGYVCREPGAPGVLFAFTNYGVALGLQAAECHQDRVEAIIARFDTYRAGDHYDRDAITHVMGCVARLPGAFLTDNAATTLGL